MHCFLLLGRLFSGGSAPRKPLLTLALMKARAASAKWCKVKHRSGSRSTAEHEQTGIKGARRALREEEEEGRSNGRDTIRDVFN